MKKSQPKIRTVYRTCGLIPGSPLDIALDRMIDEVEAEMRLNEAMDDVNEGGPDDPAQFSNDRG